MFNLGYGNVILTVLVAAAVIGTVRAAARKATREARLRRGAGASVCWGGA